MSSVDWIWLWLKVLVVLHGYMDQQQSVPIFRLESFQYLTVSSSHLSFHLDTWSLLSSERNTMEPITFTFTTPLPRDHPTPIHIQSSYQSLPSLRPSDRFEAPYAHPTPIRMVTTISDIIINNLFQSSYKPSFHSSFAQQPPPIFTQNFQVFVPLLLISIKLISIVDSIIDLSSISISSFISL